MEKKHIITSEIALENKIKTLKEVKIDKKNWEVFYIDESTGEKWVEEFPSSYLQAGGPPQLRLLERFPWEIK